MLIVSIDPGKSYLGFTCGVCDDNYSNFRVNYIKLINLTTISYKHKAIIRKDCKLHHSNELSDRVDHFIQEYKNQLEACDIVFIERQPINGHTDIEQLLFKAFRSKAELVSPNAMHKTFGINGMKKLPNEERRLWRKQQTTKFCMRYLHGDAKEEFQRMVDAYERDSANAPKPFDIADSICLAVHQLMQKRLDRKAVRGALSKFIYNATLK